MKYGSQTNALFLALARDPHYGIRKTNFYPVDALAARANGRRVPKPKAPKKKRGK